MSRRHLDAVLPLFEILILILEAFSQAVAADYCGVRGVEAGEGGVGTEVKRAFQKRSGDEGLRRARALV